MLFFYELFFFFSMVTVMRTLQSGAGVNGQLQTETFNTSLSTSVFSVTLIIHRVTLNEENQEKYFKIEENIYHLLSFRVFMNLMFMLFLLSWI